MRIVKSWKIVMAESWERLQHETSKQYEAFQTYLELGTDRNIRKAANLVAEGEASGERISRFKVWSTNNEWVRRAVEYDTWMMDQRRRIIENEVLDMAERHAREAIVFQQRVIDKLANFDSGTLTPSELIRWWEISVKVERLARGEPTERVSTEQTGTLTIMQQIAAMSDEELESEIRRYKHTG